MPKRIKLEQKISLAVKNMISYLVEQGLEPSDTHHYGAIDIDPKHLALHIIFETTKERNRAEAMPGLIDHCFSLLKQAGYPKGKKQGVLIAFQSKQEINEKANGNWYYYFK